MDDYKPLARAGEGAHGFVIKALDRKTQKLVALKKISFNPNLPVPKNTMREICALRVLRAPNIVELLDLRGLGSSVVLVMEYLPCSLSELLKNVSTPLTLSQIKTYMKMFLKGVQHIHNNHIMHRDLKPANLLLSEEGVLKIADFGLARIYKDSPIRTYSHQVATRWYRAPELLYGSRTYSQKVDMWAVGCILGEMVNRQPLFPGETDIEQLAIVLGTLGTPNEEMWPGLTDLPDYNKISFSYMNGKDWNTIIADADKSTLDLVKSLLQYDELKRPSADEALSHDFFYEHPLCCPMENMPSILEVKETMNKKMEELDEILEKFSDTFF